jgi:Luciferase
MAETRTPSRQITDEVTSWPGVEAGQGARGEYAFKVGRREIGHLHGDRVAHFGFPKQVWATLFEQKRIDYHPVFPGKPGFGARAIEDQDDVRDVIELLRLNYDRVVTRHGLPAQTASSAAG